MLPEMYFVQCRPDMFDVACEDICYESLSIHDFTRYRYCVPDTRKVHGLMQDNAGFCYVNVG